MRSSDGDSSGAWLQEVELRMRMPRRDSNSQGKGLSRDTGAPALSGHSGIANLPKRSMRIPHRSSFSPCGTADSKWRAHGESNPDYRIDNPESSPLNDEPESVRAPPRCARLHIPAALRARNACARHCIACLCLEENLCARHCIACFLFLCLESNRVRRELHFPFFMS